MPSLARFAVVALVGITALTLGACAPDDHQLGPAPTGEGTFDPATDPVNASVGLNCGELLTDQVVYDWGSGNFALDVDYEPAAGSAAAQIVTEGGLACRWVNLTSSETVDVAVAAPESTVLESAAATAAESAEPATAISPTAYFSSADGIGRVDAFTDRYWLTAQSSWFLGQEDAAPLITAAIAALG